MGAVYLHHFRTQPVFGGLAALCFFLASSSKPRFSRGWPPGRAVVPSIMKVMIAKASSERNEEAFIVDWLGNKGQSLAVWDGLIGQGEVESLRDGKDKALWE